MATNFKGSIRAGFSIVYDDAAAAAVFKQAKISVPPEVPLTFGTGAGQCNLLYAASHTLAASGGVTLDMAGAQVNDALGVAVTFVRIRGIWVRSAAGNTNNVRIGNLTNSCLLGFGAATHQWEVPPGGDFLATFPNGNGWTVTASTADLLRFLNSGAGTSVSWDMAIIGGNA